MISAAEVMPMLVAACPSFSAQWQQLEHDDEYLDEAGGRLHYLDAAEFVEHLVALFRRANAQEVGAAVSVIERFHVDGDAYVTELATIGYLEGIQLTLNRDSGEAEQFMSLLGPESTRWWRGLREFWTGACTSVRAVDSDALPRKGTPRLSAEG